MERAWSLASILCLCAAGVLLFLGKESAAFVVAALGAVAWFLGYRVKLRASIVETPDAAGEEDEEEIEDDDDVEK